MKVRNKWQRHVIKNVAKKIDCSEKEVLYFLVEMGCGWCVMANKPIKEREETFSKLDEMFDSNEECKKMAREIYINWEAGQKAGSHGKNKR